MNIKRRNTRELSMKILYAYRYDNNKDIKSFIDIFLSQNSDINKEFDKEYLERIATGVIQNQNSIDSLIEKYSKDWEINRIPKVELELLRIAIFELLYVAEVPVSVAIDEAVDLANIFGGENAPKFVNGILGSIADNEINR
ncbi:transcription antitermination factor NusB [Caldicellulosiruptoraceae bacterium PP1]